MKDVRNKFRTEKGNTSILNPDDYLSLKEIGELMGVSPRTIGYYRNPDFGKKVNRPVFPEYNWVDRPTRVRYWKKEEKLF